jgi:DNA-binding NarL/FixJ family response regulator
VGIEPGLEKKLFQPYFQINNPRFKKNQGLGLGLPIVKNIVDQLGGEISVTNNLESRRGASFLVLLNKYVPEVDKSELPGTEYKVEKIRPDIEKFEYCDTPFDEAKQTVLLVEDNTEMLSYILQKLKTKFNIYSAVNGREAIKKLKSLKRVPDLIVSDVMMDSLDGFSLMEIISNNSSYKHIPVIFLSAKSTNKDKIKGLSLGAIDFLEKPFSIEILIKKIESILANARNQRKALMEIAYQALKEDHAPTAPEDDTLEANVALYNLTAREKEIASLLMQGYTYKSISAALFISEKTVTKHVQNLYGKLEVSNKMEMLHKLGGKVVEF